MAAAKKKSTSKARSGGKRKSSTKAKSRRRPAAGRSDKSVEAFRDALDRNLTVSRERLQEVFDDAVRRGRMTRTDATDLVSEIFARGRSTTEDLVDRARRATGLGPSFPITGYENLTAAQVQSKVEKLSPAELRKVRDYERRNANRKTVLAAIETKLG